MCKIDRMDIELSDPRGWEGLRRAHTLKLEDLAALLANRTDPLGRARYVEVLAASDEMEDVLRANELLAETDERLRPALTVMVLARLAAWHEAQRVARAYVPPAGSKDDLALEGSCLLGLFGAMAERQLGSHRMAERLLGMALLAGQILGLRARGIAIRGEALRGATLAGEGNPEALRMLLAEPDLNQWQREANTYSLAESLGARGQYREALEVVAHLEDSRALGMAAFYRALLGLPFEDLGGSDDWLRLARAVRQYGREDLSPLDLSGITYEPQATYARLLTAAAVLRGPQPGRAGVTAGPTPPEPHDQRAMWVMLRLGVLAKGYETEGAARLLEVWRSAVEGLYDLAPLIAFLSARASERLWLLAHLQDAPDELVRWRERAVVLRGITVTDGPVEHRAAGRAGAVLIAEAAGALVNELTNGEERRLQIRLKKLKLRPPYVNVGYALRAALGIRDAARRIGADLPEAEELPRVLMAGMANDAQELVYPVVEEVNHVQAQERTAGGLSAAAAALDVRAR
ncbi:hypothetical protein [Deinococcus soli (ex Cha et al. 2016)]|uniref:Uncharacterized protein n=1 Tax=Deinococcus soli (ex Cha et al. 2016) TaxID=1309411 RepID=A0ACC6KM38_9DEIO|nr:hypothetical protein [Deinococcus soli (ex Cha et al. 2016)]MDR6753473.1 hypothetical protein [Deinococcus soli (ex Cha et al. 2016)]